MKRDYPGSAFPGNAALNGGGITFFFIINIYNRKII